MQPQIIDLDGGLTQQLEVSSFGDAPILPAADWGPQIRLACGFRRFRRFQSWLDDHLPFDGPATTFYGSGDFHHVTLALLARVRTPFNLLVLDKHPDWMRGIPFLHCGTWLRHALRLPGLNRVFHCGGETDFDNAYRWLAPWRALQSRRIVVFPGRRNFTRGRWASLAERPLHNPDATPAEVLASALKPYRDELKQYPLYISIDKDVLVAEDAAVNWDSGHLRLSEATEVLRTFVEAAEGNLAGADLLGDWSKIRLGHWLNRLADWVDHPSPDHEPTDAALRNATANTALLAAISTESITVGRFSKTGPLLHS